MELPYDFTSLMSDVMGEAAANALFRSMEEDAPVSVRLNPLKPASPEWLKEASPVPWCKGAFYLNSHPQFTLDPLFHAGCYYVQEASSMFLDFALRSILPRARSQKSDGEAAAPLQVLDLCAAPGGKSTDALGVLEGSDFLTANEVMPLRAQTLAENIRKWGHRNVRVTQNQPRDFATTGSRFDIIIADVPCSGEGMFRKKDAAITQWSVDYTLEMAQLQRSIIADVWPCLKPGGFLIYSTCTYNPHEDEENVQSIIDTYGAESIDLSPDPSWGIQSAFDGALPATSTRPHVYHLLPSRLRGEGFFLSVLRKSDDSEDVPTRTSKKRRKGNQGELNILFEGSSLDDMPKEAVELTLMDARRYLRGESLVLPADVARGLVTVCYQGYPLGQMKNLGSRANNLYPKNSRIRTTYIES